MAKRDTERTRASKRTAKASRSAPAKTVAAKRTASAAAPGKSKGRSGGVVDAPGKKHRAPMAGDPDANLADAQAAKLRTALTMVKTHRRRGRG